MATVQDYTEFTTVVDELMSEFGRDITYIRKDRDPSDADKPHKSDAGTETTVTAKSVSVGSLFSALDMAHLQILFQQDISTKSDGFITSGPAKIGQDLTTFDQLLDGTEVKEIRDVAEAKPGDTVIFYWVEVEN